MLAQKVQNALRLSAVCPLGLRQGLRVGMALADARARLPDLDVEQADPAADARFLARLARYSTRWSPIVAQDGMQGLVLDMTGGCHLWGTEAGLLQDVQTRMARHLRLSVQLALADTAPGAGVLARHVGAARTWNVTGAAHRQAMRALPVSTLGLEGKALRVVTAAGLKTLGNLLDMASASLAARIGQAALYRLDQLMGDAPAPLTPLRPPPSFAVSRLPHEPILSQAQVMHEAQAALETLCEQMTRRGVGATRLAMICMRADGSQVRIAVATSRPQRDPGMLLGLLESRLDRLATPLDPGFGFDLIGLEVERHAPFEAHQHGLDGHSRTDHDVSALMDRLCARFGAARVFRLVPCDSHWPPRAQAILSAQNQLPQAIGGVPVLDAWPPRPALTPGLAGAPAERPLCVFEPALPIQALAEIPDGAPRRFRWRRVVHDVTRAEGPERILPPWWGADADAPVRDYYQVEDRDGRRFWVFRAHSPAGEGAPSGWFMAGLFA